MYLIINSDGELVETSTLFSFTIWKSQWSCLCCETGMTLTGWFHAVFILLVQCTMNWPDVQNSQRYFIPVRFDWLHLAGILMITVTGTNEMIINGSFLKHSIRYKIRLDLPRANVAITYLYVPRLGPTWAGLTLKLETSLFKIHRPLSEKTTWKSRMYGKIEKKTRWADYCTTALSSGVFHRQMTNTR